MHVSTLQLAAKRNLLSSLAQTVRLVRSSSRAVSACSTNHTLHQQAEQPATSRLFSTLRGSLSRGTLTATSNRSLGFPVSPCSGVFARAWFNTIAPITQEPTVHSVFETYTGTWQYIVADPATNAAVIIDPVLDYDPTTQSIKTESADSLLALITSNDYSVSWILETHAHADHLTASSYLQKQLALRNGSKPLIGIGKRIGKVQELFAKGYGVPANEYEGVFDKLFDDDEEFEIGSLKAKAIHLPGHTPDHLGYKIGDNVFSGDSIFHVDIGTARCDFPGGNISSLWASAQKLLAMPDHTKIWTGHDYPPDGRTDPVPYMTVRQHKEQNMHLKKDIEKEGFVKMRKERDASLAAPRLLHPSLQTNIRGGRLPEANEAGHRLLHLPLKTGGVKW